MLRLFIIGMFAISALIGIDSAQAGTVDSEAVLSSVDVGVREVGLGSLVADAVMTEVGASIALIPAGSFREIVIPKGKVKTEEVIRCLQYPDDRIAVIELTGEQLVAALERGLSIHPQRNLGFLQVAGVAVQFDPDLLKGERILKITVGENQISNSRKYRIATSEPLAKGAYGYFTIWGKDLPVTMQDKTMAQAITSFLARQKSVDYRETVRITAKQE